MLSGLSEKSYKGIIKASIFIVIISLSIISLAFVLMKNKPNPTVQPVSVGEFVSSVSPSEDKVCSSGENVRFSVKAKSGSSAYVMILGQKIPLTVTSEDGDGFVILSADALMPESTSEIQQLGNAAFFVTYDSITQIIYGGKLTVSALQSGGESATETVTVPYDVPDLETDTKTALVVTGPIAEGKDVTSSELFYNPTYGNLVTGMTDYVVCRIIDYDDDGNEVDFYKLMSGRAVKADSNVKLVETSGTQKYNTVSLSVKSDASSTYIVMSETMKVPYKIHYVGQNFTKGYETLAYNAKPFTASAVEFIFDYTVSFSGSLSSFSDNIVSLVEPVLNPIDKTLTLRCYLRTPGKFYGYIMEYDESGNLNLSFRQPVKSINDLTVIIDPGHGGNPGALDYTGKYREADQTLAISKNLAAYLSSAGATVYMTRTTDVEVSLETRRLMNQQIKPDLFISVHLNGAETTSRSGTSTYYFTPFSQPVASFINNRLTGVFNTCYRDNPDMLKKVNGGDRYYPFFIARTDVCPSVLVEVGFFTHPLESKYLIDSAYQQVFAKAIYEAVCDYVACQ